MINDKRIGGRRIKRRKPPLSSPLNPNLTAKSINANRLAVQLVTEIDESQRRRATSDVFVARVVVVECLLANLANLANLCSPELIQVPRNEFFYRTQRFSYSAIITVTNAFCSLDYLSRYSLNANGPVTKYSATPKLAALLARMTPDDFGHFAAGNATIAAAKAA